MTKLYLLGPAEIRNEEGELEHSFLAGPKRLALLVYLLLHKPQGFHRRDSLLPLFWPEQDQKSARNALSNMLYHIRKTLGKEAIENRGAEEVKINPEALWADTIAFRKAYREEDLPGAMDLYRGELLKGFHVSDISTEFDYWLEQERKRFHNLAIESCIGLAEKYFREGDINSSGTFIKRAASLDPYSEPLHIKLISFLNNIGDQQAALDLYETYSHLIHREFGDDPDKHLKTLAEELKMGIKSPPQLPLNKFKAEEKKLEPSIAVLPFETLGVEKASSFTDAIHSDILTRLSQVSDLIVISRTSVRNFKGTSKLLPEIARELQVQWVLTGEVQEIGKQVKVSVRLVNGVQDRQVWAEIYQRQLSAGEVFKIQSEITHNIIVALEMRLSNKEKKALKHIPTQDLEAFRLQAHGKWNLDQRSEKAMRLAEEYFRAAIERDPEYAQAWMGLADTLSLLHDYGYEKNGQTILPEAEKAANEALRIDPGLAEAYASLGLLHTTLREADAAIYNLKKAVELRPGYAEAHAWLCWVLLLTGNRKEGLENARKGVEWNPLSQEALGNLSLALLSIGEYETALGEAQRLLQLQPDFTTARFEAGLAFYHLGKYGEAMEILRDLSVPWAGNGPIVTMILSYYRSGQEAEAKKLIDNIKDDPFAIGLIHLIEGNYEEAYTIFLEIQHWNYWEMLSIFHYYPELLDPVRKDKRFSQILKTVNSNWGISNSKLPIQKETSEAEIIENRESGSKNSIAVLPFKDLNSIDPRFSYGLHGDILTSLSRVKDQQVIYRTSVNHYENTTKTAAEIGKELNVLWLLEGEVKQTTEDIKVSLRLINISTNSEVWTAIYRKKLTAENIFLIQENITKEILDALNVHPIRPEKQYEVQNPTNNLQAYRLYIQGRSCLDQRTESAIYQGLDCFQGAIETDPDYALAWCGMADALSLLHFYGFSVPKNSLDPVDTAMRAVNLDPNLSEVHVALGIAFSMKQEGPAALKELEHAVALSPGHAEALIWLGWLNIIIGKPENGLTPAIHAVRLNPLTPAVRVFLAEIYLSNGLYKEALAEARRGREINPDYGLAHYMEGLAYYHNHMLDAAANAFEESLSKIHGRGTPSVAEVKTALAFTQYALGDKAPAVKLKEEIYGRIDPFPLGMLQALLGENDEAFDTFSKVQDWSSFATETIRYFFPDVLSSVRKDRRFQDLLHKVNRVWGLPGEI